MGKLILVRHGHTSLNRPGDDERLRSWLDVPLDDKGMEEVAKTADTLRKYPIDVIYCSDLRRARQTAEVVRRRVKAPHMLLSSGNSAVYRMESMIFTLFEPRFRPLSKPRNKRKMLDAWYETRLYGRSGLEPSEIEPRIMAECQNGGDFLRIVMEQMCRKDGVERWAESEQSGFPPSRSANETRRESDQLTNPT
jgi:Histidine phosphatase superfamily (branch 1)